MNNKKFVLSLILDGLFLIVFGMLFGILQTSLLYLIPIITGLLMIVLSAWTIHKEGDKEDE